jgi:hypothetical protein
LRPALRRPVMAGAMRPDERRGYDGGGAGESAQGSYGGAGAFGHWFDG